MRETLLLKLKKLKKLKIGSLNLFVSMLSTTKAYKSKFNLIDKPILALTMESLTQVNYQTVSVSLRIKSQITMHLLS